MKSPLPTSPLNGQISHLDKADQQTPVDVLSDLTEHPETTSSPRRYSVKRRYSAPPAPKVQVPTTELTPTLASVMRRKSIPELFGGEMPEKNAEVGEDHEEDFPYTNSFTSPRQDNLDPDLETDDDLSIDNLDSALTFDDSSTDILPSSDTDTLTPSSVSEKSLKKVENDEAQAEMSHDAFESPLPSPESGNLSRSSTTESISSIVIEPELNHNHKREEVEEAAEEKFLNLDSVLIVADKSAIDEGVKDRTVATAGTSQSETEGIRGTGMSGDASKRPERNHESVAEPNPEKTKVVELLKAKAKEMSQAIAEAIAKTSDEDAIEKAATQAAEEKFLDFDSVERLSILDTEDIPFAYIKNSQPLGDKVRPTVGECNLQYIVDINSLDIHNITEVNTKNYLRILEAKLNELENSKEAVCSEVQIIAPQASQSGHYDPQEWDKYQRQLGIIERIGNISVEDRQSNDKGKTYAESSLLEKNRLLLDYLSLAPNQEENIQELNKQFREHADQMMMLGIKTHIETLQKAEEEPDENKKKSIEDTSYKELANCLHMYVSLYQACSHADKRERAKESALKRFIHYFNLANTYTNKLNREKAEKGYIGLSFFFALFSGGWFASSAYFSSGEMHEADPGVLTNEEEILAAITAAASGFSNTSLYADSLLAFTHYFGPNVTKYLRGGNDFVTNDKNEMVYITPSDKVNIVLGSVNYSFVFFTLLFTGLEEHLGNFIYFLLPFVFPSLSLSIKFHNDFHVNQVNAKIRNSFRLISFTEESKEFQKAFWNIVLTQEFQVAFWTKTIALTFFPFTAAALALEYAIVKALNSALNQAYQQEIWNYLTSDLINKEDEGKVKIWQRFIDWRDQLISIISMGAGVVVAIGVALSILQKVYNLFTDLFSLNLTIADVIAGVEYAQYATDLSLLVYLLCIQSAIFIAQIDFGSPWANRLKWGLITCLVTTAILAMSVLVVIFGWEILALAAASIIAAKFFITILKMICNMIFGFPQLISTLQKVTSGRGFLHGFLVTLLIGFVFLGICFFNAAAQANITMNGLQDGSLELFNNGNKILWASNFLNSFILTSRSIIVLAGKFIPKFVKAIYESAYMEYWHGYLKDLTGINAFLAHGAFYLTSLFMFTVALVPTTLYTAYYLYMHLVSAVYSLGCVMTAWGLTLLTPSATQKPKSPFEEMDLDNPEGKTSEPSANTTIKDQLKLCATTTLNLIAQGLFLAVKTLFQIGALVIGVSFVAAGTILGLPHYLRYSWEKSKQDNASRANDKQEKNEDTLLSEDIKSGTSPSVAKKVTHFFDNVFKPKNSPTPGEVMGNMMAIATPKVDRAPIPRTDSTPVLALQG